MPAAATRVVVTGTQSCEANHELFLFKKGNDGVRKIARHSFTPISRR